MVTLKLNTNPISEVQLQKRHDLERQLRKDKEELETLGRSLALAEDATQRINGMLNSFDTRLARLESFIMPIHNSTQVLSRTNHNLDTAISLISAYTNVVGAINYHEAIVIKGLAQSSLEGYLDSVKKLKDALHQLETSKYKSSERITQDLRGRLSKGIQELDDLFGKILVTCGETTIESDIADGIFTYGDKLITLQTLAGVLSDSLEQIGPVTGFLQLYSSYRSAFLLKGISANSAAAKDQEVKMGYSRDVYQKGTSALVPYARSLIAMLQTEYLVCTEVIPKHHLATVFVNTVTLVVDGFIEAVDGLSNRVRRSIQRRDSNELYILIDVWEGLSNMFTPYSALLAHCGKKGTDIKTMLINIASTVLNYFKDFFEECKTDSNAKNPSALSLDGTVHETTSTTMNAVKKIYEFNDALTSMLETDKSTGVGFPTDSVYDYINKILDLLLLDLEAKAKNYKKPVLASLFILNNAHYTLKSIKGTVLTAVVSPTVMSNIDKMMKKQFDSYRNSWIPIIEHLMDNTKINDNGKIVTQLSKAQRDVIKDKFKNFNKDFDDVFATQKNYAIPDPELRTQVIKEVRQILCPMFDRFYDRYTTSLEFTKHIDKYVKYNKDELTAKLDQFFDASS